MHSGLVIISCVHYESSKTAWVLFASVSADVANKCVLIENWDVLP